LSCASLAPHVLSFLPLPYLIPPFLLPFFCTPRSPPTSPLFPYTTLFRSAAATSSSMVGPRFSGNCNSVQPPPILIQAPGGWVRAVSRMRSRPLARLGRPIQLNSTE